MDIIFWIGMGFFTVAVSAKVYIHFKDKPLESGDWPDRGGDRSPLAEDDRKGPGRPEAFNSATPPAEWGVDKCKQND